MTRLPSLYRLQLQTLERRFQRAGLRPSQVAVPSGSLRCWTGGRGPPLVLLQGFGASALWQWHPQVRALSREFTLYVPDLLFFGESTSPRPERSLELQAQALIELLDQRGVEDFHLAGISYGGLVAQALIQARGARVRRLALVDSPGAGYTENDYRALLARYGVGHIADVLLPETPDGIRRLLRIAWHRPPWIPGFMLPDIHAGMFRDGVAEKRALLEDAVARLRGPAPERWANPTLLLWGQHDPLFPLPLAERMRARLGRAARLAVIERAAHAPNLEHAPRFNRLLIDFLCA